MSDKQDVDRPDVVLRAHQRSLDVPGDVTRVHGRKFAEPDVAADRLCILTGIGTLGLEARAEGILASATCQVGLKDVAACGDDGPFQAVNRDGVAWIDDGPRRLRDKPRIDIRKERLRVRLSLYGRASVVVRLDRDRVGEHGGRDALVNLR